MSAHSKANDGEYMKPFLTERGENESRKPQENFMLQISNLIPDKSGHESFFNIGIEIIANNFFFNFVLGSFDVLNLKVVTS